MRQTLIALLIGLITGGFLVYKYGPSKYVDKPIIQEVTHNQIETITRTVKGADGKETTVTKVIDHTVIQHTASLPEPKKQYKVELNKTNNTYDFMASHRILGDLFVGIGITTDKQMKFGVSLEF